MIKQILLHCIGILFICLILCNNIQLHETLYHKNNIQIDMIVNTNVTNTFPKAVQFNQYFVSLYNCFIVKLMRCFFSD